jgi:hypothetical protein
MRRVVVYAFRFALILVLVSAIPMLSGPSGPAGSPYLSALSSLAVPQTFAKSTCNFKGCGGSRYNEACNPITVPGNCVNYKGFCLVSNCT